jgi:hypothetical protein
VYAHYVALFSTFVTGRYLKLTIPPCKHRVNHFSCVICFVAHCMHLARKGDPLDIRDPPGRLSTSLIIPNTIDSNSHTGNTFRTGVLVSCSHQRTVNEWLTCNALRFLSGVYIPGCVTKQVNNSLQSNIYN